MNSTDGVTRYPAVVVRTDVLPAPRLSGAEPKVLAGGLAVLAATYTLPLFWDRGVSPIPPCLFHQLTGQPCPFCGGTRCFVAMAHGHIGTAIYLYPIGPLLVLAMLAGIAYSAAALITGRRWRPRVVLRDRRLIAAVVVAALAANWALKLLVLGFGPLTY